MFLSCRSVSMFSGTKTQGSGKFSKLKFNPPKNPGMARTLLSGKWLCQEKDRKGMTSCMESLRKGVVETPLAKFLEQGPKPIQQASLFKSNLLDVASDLSFSRRPTVCPTLRSQVMLLRASCQDLQLPTTEQQFLCRVPVFGFHTFPFLSWFGCQICQRSVKSTCMQEGHAVPRFYSQRQATEHDFSGTSSISFQKLEASLVKIRATSATCATSGLSSFSFNVSF